MGFDFDRKKSKLSSYGPIVYLTLAVAFFFEWWYFSAERTKHFNLNSDMKISHEELIVLLSDNSTNFFIVTGIIFAIFAVYFTVSTISQRRFRKEQERFYKDAMMASGNYFEG